MHQKDTGAALKWIVGILYKHDIPFQIAGGFAARVYGSERELYDIDFEIPEESFEKILPEVQPYIIYGPVQYKDDHWDLLLLTLSYKDQLIDISGAYNIKEFDVASQTWISAPADLKAVQMMSVYGIEVPIIPKATLIEYKKSVGRDVDKIDIEALDK